MNGRDEELEKALSKWLGPRLLSLLRGLGKLELEDFQMDIGELELWIPVGSERTPVTPGIPVEEVKTFPRPDSILEEGFVPANEEYPCRIREITLGATAGGGGTRGKTITIGGASAPVLHAGTPLRPPVIALDVFDAKIPLPRCLKAHIRDLLDNPVEWARFNVERLGAEIVTIHLTSTDPLIADTPPRKAAALVEEILQQVQVPLIVGGCGDPKKDAEVFAEVAATASGERLLLNSVTLEMGEARVLEHVAHAAREHNHILLAFTGLDLNRAKELNRRLYEFIPPEQIVMDLTTAALGYGLEYSFSIHERARIAALMGDTELQHPVVSGSTNAWAAREAWMELDPVWGPREFRGPLWETLTALILMMAGMDLFMMMHPAAVSTVREIAGQLSAQGGAPVSEPYAWIGMRG